MSFLWWKVNEYGLAQAYPDTPEIQHRVDTERGWYGNVEGCILAGVQATAYKRKVERLYETAPWLNDRAMVPSGERTTITDSITGKVIKVTFGRS